MKNLMKIGVAHGIIKSIHYPWRLGEKLAGRSFGYRHHYYIMKVFRALASNYFVDVTWRNPFVTERQLKFRLDLCQNTQQFLFRARSNYELEWVDAVYNGLENADCFLDIGSNVGIFAVTIGQAMPKKKVIAVEALKNNYLLLKSNVEQNKLGNVTPLWAAIAPQRGKIRFYINPIHDGGGSLLLKDHYQTGNISVSVEKYQDKHPDFCPYQDVEAYRIDNLAQGKCVLKIDVEGAELQVLESGREAFQEGKIDMAIVEVEHETIDEVLRWFAQFDFDCFDLHRRVLLKHGNRLNHFTENILCLKKETAVHKKFLSS